MASAEDLAKVMQNALEQSGDLALLRVQLEDKAVALRSNVTDNVHGFAPSGATETIKPTMPNEIYIVNELIREYCHSVGCKKTAAVLTAESGLPVVPLPPTELRRILAPGKKLGKNGPLLKTMVDYVLK